MRPFVVSRCVLLSFCGGLALSMFASAAAAQAVGASAPLSGTEVTLAETLYREGRQLMNEQRYTEACAKFAESNRLDPATGTMLNLAACFEASGKLASAWIAFGEALRASRREDRRDRVEFAERRLAAIEPRLSRLTVTVEPGDANLVVKVDGVIIGPAAYGVATPIDPGPHRVEASAPGLQPWTREILIGETAAQEKVTVPRLEAEPAAARSPALPPARVDVAPVEPSPPAQRPIPTAAYVSGGAAVLFTAGAIASGLSYLNQRKELDAMASDPSASLAARRDKYDSAQLSGWLNAGFSAAALVSASITVYVYLSRPEVPAARRTAFEPWLGRDRLGLSLSSEF